MKALANQLGMEKVTSVEKFRRLLAQKCKLVVAVAKLLFLHLLCQLRLFIIHKLFSIDVAQPTRMETQPDALVSRVMESAQSVVYKLDNTDFHDDAHSSPLEMGESSDQNSDSLDVQGYFLIENPFLPISGIMIE